MKKIFNFTKQEIKIFITTLFFSMLLFATMFIITFLINLHITRTVAEEALLRGKSIANYIELTARESLIKENKLQFSDLDKKNTSLTEFIHSIVSQDKSIKYVIVQDSKGKTIINIKTGAKDKNDGYSYNKEIKINIQDHSVVIDENKVTVIKDFPKQIFDLSVPIKMGKEDIGLIHLGLSPEKERRIIQVTNDKVIKITTYASIIAFILIVIAYIYTSYAISKSMDLEARVLQSEKLAYIGELASGLAHEIRNPLNAMALNIQLLQENCHNKVDEDSIKKMDKIHHEVFHLERILTDFLDFSKPTKSEMEPTNVKDLLLEVVELLKPELDKKNIHLTLELEKSIPMINLDNKKMKQVLFNLIINASQAISNTQGKITIKASSASKKITLDVTDNGCGMTDEIQNRIFTLFYSTKKDGTGIGLPIVKKIIREHNGDITVKSKINEGSTFTITLPI